MDLSDQEQSPTSKRNDVGYKRPPREHQFKKGQKPPPRKMRQQKGVSKRDLFWKILHERRRITPNGNPIWVTNADLIARRAFFEAEKGAITLQRLIDELLLRSDPEPEQDTPDILYAEPSDEPGEKYAIRSGWIKESPSQES